jgi:hypothetical protein
MNVNCKSLPNNFKNINRGITKKISCNIFDSAFFSLLFFFHLISMTSFDSAAPTTVSKLSVSTSKDNNNLQGPTVAAIDSGAVQAYAKLEGDDFCYYVRTLQVTMGRKVSNPENVDILLGNTKSVSRQHARLFFNFSTQRFELMVFGKNGAFVNERFVEKGVTVPLDNK